MMEEHNIAYFRNLWQSNVKDIEDHCDVWENICKSNIIPDEVNGEIRTTIGLARLLMCQKLNQFKGLIDDSEFKRGEKEITCLDLQGFWDMVYNEVEKIQKSFNKLQICKNNEWTFTEDISVQPQKKKVPAHAVPRKKADSSKSHILAARQRLAEVKRKMLAQRELQKEQNFVDVQPLNEVNPEVENKDGIPIRTKSKDKTPRKQSKEGVQHSTSSRKKKQSIASEVADSIKDTLILNDALIKPVLRKSERVSVQNKENSIPDDCCNSSVQTQSKEIEMPSSEKKRRSKSKEFGKLQCLTRSAKKALLAQQKSSQN